MAFGGLAGAAAVGATVIGADETWFRVLMALLVFNLGYATRGVWDTHVDVDYFLPCIRCTEVFRGRTVGLALARLQEHLEQEHGIYGSDL